MITILQHFYRGNIHTARIDLSQKEGATVSREYLDNRISRQSIVSTKEGKVKYLTFNPNKGDPLAHYNKHFLECRTLSDFIYSYDQWKAMESIPPNAAAISRIDFKIDHGFYSGIDAEHWRKYCDLLIAIFNTKHNVSEKYQYYGETQLTMQHKNNKTQHGCIELECYNKAIQQESAGLKYRLELRYDKHKSRNKNLNGLSPVEMLDTLAREVLTLPTYYDEALYQMNLGLYNAFMQRQIKPNAFICDHSDRVFSRDQLTDFFSLIGKSNPQTVTRNYTSRFDCFFITKKDFDSFAAAIASSIDKYIKNDANWHPANALSPRHFSF